MHLIMNIPLIIERKSMYIVQLIEVIFTGDSIMKKIVFFY